TGGGAGPHAIGGDRLHVRERGDHYVVAHGRDRHLAGVVERDLELGARGRDGDRADVVLPRVVAFDHGRAVGAAGGGLAAGRCRGRGFRGRGFGGGGRFRRRDRRFGGLRRRVRGRGGVGGVGRLPATRGEGEGAGGGEEGGACIHVQAPCR